MSLLQVRGKVVDLAMSHTASRIIQACAKHGSAQHRQQLTAEVTPRAIEVAKSPYGHFLLCKLINLASKSELPGTLQAEAALCSFVSVPEGMSHVHQGMVRLFCGIKHVTLSYAGCCIRTLSQIDKSN